MAYTKKEQSYKFFLLEKNTSELKIDYQKKMYEMK